MQWYRLCLCVGAPIAEGEGRVRRGPPPALACALSSSRSFLSISSFSSLRSCLICSAIPMDGVSAHGKVSIFSPLRVRTRPTSVPARGC
jgi:hypothetical protein